MTLINKITRLRHPGVLRNFTWPADLPDFGRYNLIYGWNGTGKTTISNLFRALELRQTPEGEVTIVANNVSLTGSEFSQTTVPIRVFNRDFISASVFPIGGGAVPPIFVFGKESADKQEQVERLKSQRTEILQAQESAKKGKNQADNALGKHCVDTATVIRETLRSSGINPYNNYDKTRYKQRTELMTRVGDWKSHLLEDDTRSRLISQSRATPKDRIDELQLSMPALEKMAEATEHLLQASVVSSVIDILKEDPELASWTRHGLSLHQERHAGECLFCEQPIPDHRIGQLEAHFSTEYESLLRKLDTQIAHTETASRALTQVPLPNRAEFYEDLSADFDQAKATFNDVLEKIRGYLTALTESLQNKKQNPFVVFQLEVSAPVVPPAIGDINEIIGRHNKTCTEFDSHVKSAREKLEANFVATSLEEYLRLVEDEVAQNNFVFQADTKSQKLKDQIEQLEREIIEHRQPAEELNDDLHKYLGHAELQLDVKDTGYTITRNGIPARSLSEGEMTAIALLYFLKSLQDRRFEMDKGLVVLDDPVSSLDANALFLAFGFIRQCTNDAAQLLILTHNFAMFRQVRNWFHHLKGQNKKDIAQRPARFYMMECSLTDQGRRSLIAPLDPLLEQFESEYHYLFARVYRRSQANGQTGLEANYIFPNMARRLLETFLAFRRPQHSGELRQKLQGISFDETKKLRILRFLHTHSHADAIVDPEHDPSALGEAQAVLTDLLALIKHEDPGHHDAMVVLVNPPPDGETNT